MNYRRHPEVAAAGVGDKAKADTPMAGDYINISSDLTAAMMKWKAAAQ